MYVLSLCREYCPDVIPDISLAETIDDSGSDGEVIAIKDDTNKVIKFSIIYEDPEITPEERYQRDILPGINHILKNSSSFCAHVYSHGYLGQFYRPPPFCRLVALHYTIMERLAPLTEDECRVFHSLLSHEDRGLKKSLSHHRTEELLVGLAKGLDFDQERVMLFLDALRDASFVHRDLHPRNVMKDMQGNFKLIDFDRLILGE